MVSPVSMFLAWCTWPPSRVTDEHGLIVGSEVSYLKGKVFRGKAGA